MGWSSGLLAAIAVGSGMALAIPVMAQEAGLPSRLEGHGGPVRGVDIDSAGERALTGSFDYAVILWDLPAGEIIHRLIGHDAAVNDVAFVPGTTLAVSASDDGTVGLWDLSAGRLVERFAGTGDKVLDVDVSPDGRLAAAAVWNGTARVFDLESRRETAVLEGHGGNVNAVAFSADGASVFTGAADGDIRRFDTASGEFRRAVLQHGWGINVLRVLPDERLLFGAVDGAAGLVDPEQGLERELPVHQGPVLVADISVADGIAIVAGAEGALQVYGLEDWELRHEHTNPYGPIWAAAIVPGAGTVYYGGLDDYAIGLQIDPQLPMDPVDGEFPRRFQASADMGPGEAQFARKCSVCHTLTEDGGNRAGPTLHRIFGRKAGSLPGYPYSEALKDSDIVWTEETVGDLFEHGPDIVTPGSKMPLQRMKNDEERDALIAFLKQAAGGPDAGSR